MTDQTDSEMRLNEKRKQVVRKVLGKKQKVLVKDSYKGRFAGASEKVRLDTSTGTTVESGWCRFLLIPVPPARDKSLS